MFLSFNTAVTTTSPDDAVKFYGQAFPTVRSVVRGVHVLNLMMEELAAQEGVAFLATGEGLLGRYDSDLYIDVVHFTTKGDALMAANVYQRLLPHLLRDQSLKCMPQMRSG